MKTIEPSQLTKALEADGAELIDVRTPAEFREIHLDFAKNFPLDQLDPQHWLREASNRPSLHLYVICKSGGRSSMAVKRLMEAGFENVTNVAGGTEACTVAGLPVTRGKKTISLERQVRIVAGAITLVGALLGFFASPYFFAVPAFIGGGLLFAGLSNTCGMGVMLAKMPWNRT